MSAKPANAIPANADQLVWPARDPVFNAYGQTRVDAPFPIISPFLMRSDLQKLDTSLDTLTRLDCQYPQYARYRLELMKRGDSELLLARSSSIDEERNRLATLLGAIEVVSRASVAGISVQRAGSSWAIHFRSSGLIWRWKDDWVELASLRPDASDLAQWLMRSSEAERVGLHRSANGLALSLLARVWSLSMQEDFVLMAEPHDLSPEGPAHHSLPGEGMVAEALMVSFPSGWSPQAKLGLTLREIHRPVADGQALRRASPSLADAMRKKGPFVRHVWTLSSSAALDQYPGRNGIAILADPGSPETLGRNSTSAGDPYAPLSHIWFRCERQTTLALPEQNRALFLIRVYVMPLLRAIDNEHKRTTLVAALGSMSQEVIAYKNLCVLRQQVLQAWG